LNSAFGLPLTKNSLRVNAAYSQAVFLCLAVVQCWGSVIRSAARWNRGSCSWAWGEVASLPFRKSCSTRCHPTRLSFWKAPIRFAERMFPTVPLSASKSGTFLVRLISSTPHSTMRWYFAAQGLSSLS